jgi:hypothetical protein
MMTHVAGAEREEFLLWKIAHDKAVSLALWSVVEQYGRCANPICGSTFDNCLDPTDTVANIDRKRKCCSECHHPRTERVDGFVGVAAYPIGFKVPTPFLDAFWQADARPGATLGVNDEAGDNGFWLVLLAIALVVTAIAVGFGVWIA